MIAGLTKSGAATSRLHLCFGVGLATVAALTPVFVFMLNQVYLVLTESCRKLLGVTPVAAVSPAASASSPASAEIEAAPKQEKPTPKKQEKAESDKAESEKAEE